MRHDPITLASLEDIGKAFKVRAKGAMETFRTVGRLLRRGTIGEEEANLLIRKSIPSEPLGEIDIGPDASGTRRLVEVKTVPSTGKAGGLGYYNGDANAIVLSLIACADEAKASRIPIENVAKSVAYHEASHARDRFKNPRYRHVFELQEKAKSLAEMLKSIATADGSDVFQLVDPNLITDAVGTDAVFRDLRDYMIGYAEKHKEIIRLDKRESVARPEILRLRSEKDYYEQRAQRFVAKVLHTPEIQVIQKIHDLTDDQMKSLFLFYLSKGTVAQALFGTGDIAKRYWAEHVLPSEKYVRKYAPILNEAAEVAERIFEKRRCPPVESSFPDVKKRLRRVSGFKDLEKAIGDERVNAFLRSVLAKYKGSEQYVRMRDEIRAFTQQATLEAFMALDKGACGQKDRLHLTSGVAECVHKVLKKKSMAYWQLNHYLPEDEMRGVTAVIGKAIAARYLNRPDMLAAKIGKRK